MAILNWHISLTLPEKAYLRSKKLGENLIADRDCNNDTPAHRRSERHYSRHSLSACDDVEFMGKMPRLNGVTGRSFGTVDLDR